MLTQETNFLNDIDYQDQDDLALLDHVDWVNDQKGNDQIEDFGVLYWLDE